MSFFLSKFLLFFIRPLVWVVALSIYALLTKNKWRKKKAFLASVILLLFFSNNFILGTVASCYEVDDYPKGNYDVGLLLGGFSSYNTKTQTLRAEMSGDRLAQTIKLYKEERIGKILMSGGSGNLLERNPVEAVYTYQYLKSIGIPDSAIIIESQSRNTKENFVYAKQLLAKMNKPNAKILVITSAWHLPRTKLLAKKQGLQNLAFYPTNSLQDNYSFEDYLLPQGDAISGWELLIKEWVGYLTTAMGLT